MVAKRLESLGALTHGDRRATESRDLSKYNIDTKYGRSALEIVMGSVVSQKQPIVHSEEYNKSFFESKFTRCSNISTYIMCKLAYSLVRVFINNTMKVSENNGGWLLHCDWM